MALTLEEMSRGYIQSIQFRIERTQQEIKEIEPHLEELRELELHLVELKKHLQDCKDSLEIETSGNP